MARSGHAESNVCKELIELAAGNGALRVVTCEEGL